MDQVKKESRKLLITGCGRSGTLYAAELWRALGLDIRHERPVPPNGVMGADGMSSWFLAVDDPEVPSGPSGINYDFVVVIQQVRHPLKVIASVAQFILKEGERAPDFIERNVPEIKLTPDERENLASKEQLVLEASRYWYYWNKISETKADKILKLEELEYELPELTDLVGVEYQPEVLENISKETNARNWHVQDEPWVVNWDEIKRLDPKIYEEIRNLGASYGYDI